MAQVSITFEDSTLGGKPGKLVQITGQLDETNVDEEAKKIYQLIDEMAEPNMILDFAGLEYMNSKSIGYLTDWYSRVMSKNGKIAIAQPQPNILDILKVVGITQIIPVATTMDEAKQAFVGGTAPAAPAAPTPPAPPAEPAAPTPPPATPETPTTPETPAAPDSTPPAA